MNTERVYYYSKNDGAGYRNIQFAVNMAGSMAMFLFKTYNKINVKL